MKKCSLYQQCGSCELLHLPYLQQLEQKKQYCNHLLKKANLNHIQVHDVLGQDNPYYYRNKVIIGFNRQNQPGLYEENSHKIVPYHSCLLHDSIIDPIIQKIASMLKKYRIQIYHEDKRKGFLRHVLIRRGVNTNQTMVVLVTTSFIFPGSKAFVNELIQAFPSIQTIVLNKNTRKTSIVLGNEEKVIYGKGYIVDTLCSLSFKISSRSFYQINHDQCEVLYQKAIQLLDLKGDEILLDTYCGIGTIGLIVANKVKHVIGVELNKDAIQDAKVNAIKNNIRNIEFVCEDASNFMVEIAKQKIHIDALIMDPPRCGTTPTFIQSILQLQPKKVVYISCDPSTQVRDIALFNDIGYQTKDMYLVDLFPHTKHIESIVILTKQ